MGQLTQDFKSRLSGYEVYGETKTARSRSSGFASAAHSRRKANPRNPNAESVG